MRVRGGLAVGVVVSVVAGTAAVVAGPDRAGAGGATAVQTYPAPASGVFIVTGRGYGHGRGMSQHGAQGAATKGLDARRILDFYYPGTASAELPAGDRMRVLLTGLPASSLTVRAAAGLVLRDLSRGTLHPLPAGPTSWRLVPVSAGVAVQRFTGGRWAGTALGTRSAFPGAVRFEGPAALRVGAPGGGSWLVGGTLTAHPVGPGTLAVVNTLPTEDYVAAVVAREAFASWLPAALRAQAVAARTYAAYRRSAVGRGSAWDVCDTTACQVYRGRVQYDAAGRVMGTVAASVVAATRATARAIRTSGGKPIYAAFGAANGGWTVRGDGPPYLRAATDPYDAVDGSSAHRWTARVTVADVERCQPGIGRLRRVVVTARDGNGEWGGRMLKARLEGSAGRMTVTGARLRGCLGLRSTWFDLGAVALVPVRLAAGPAVLARRGAGYEVFWTGRAGDLRRRSTVDGVHFGPVEVLGGRLLSGHAVVRVTGGSALAVVRGRGDLLSEKVRMPGGAWRAYRRIGGTATSRPALAATPDGGAALVYRTAAGHVGLRLRTTAGAWSAETDLGGIVLRGYAPAVAATGGGGLVVAVVARDLKAHLRTWAGASGAGAAWSGWSTVPGRAFGDATLLARAGGKLDLYAWASGAVTHTVSATPGARWSVWQSLGGTFASGPGAAVLAGGSLAVLAARADGTLCRARYAGGRWSQWGRAFRM
jgi:stage II sporulation protein D